MKTDVYDGQSSRPIWTSLCLALALGCGGAGAADSGRNAAAVSGFSQGRVQVEQGILQGQAEGAAFAFKAVPYAAPPVGELRWKPPQPPAAWEGVRDATLYSNTCLRLSTGNELLGGSEDCLYLNVWTPQQRPATPLPVLFWVHGGFFLSGSGTLPLYDGAYLALHGPAVVVTINYRLGALGFLHAASLSAEDSQGASGDYGIQDEIAALQWVRANIAAFGGDPQRVMVFGASAGGNSGCVLYTSPLAQGLFSSVVIESGGCSAGTNQAVGDGVLATIAQSLSCPAGTDQLSCLRQKPAEQVMVAYPTNYTQPDGYRWGPFEDGKTITANPYELLASRPSSIPLMIGGTSNEYSALIGHYLSAALSTDADYQASVPNFVGTTLAPKVLAQYPSSSYSSPQQALITLLTDRNYLCPTRRIARRAVTAGTPVWRYLFTHTYESGPLAAEGAGHYMDVPFQFHNFAIDGFLPNATELALADTMGRAWVSFASTGNPNGASSPSWPAYDGQADLALGLDDSISTLSGVRSSACDFWDGTLNP